MQEKSFSALLEDLRVARGLSKTDLAKLANLTPGYVSHLTRGERAAPSENVVQALAIALNLDGEAREAFFIAAGYDHTLVAPTPGKSAVLATIQKMQAGALRTSGARVNWDEIPYTDMFYGREQELRFLEQWTVEQGCQIIAVLGIGGIGKTSLTAQFVKDVESRFDVVYWCSLRDAPPLEHALTECVKFFADQKLVGLPEDKEQQLSFLFEELAKYLSRWRCLLVLDNFDSVLQSGERAGKYRDGYGGYGRLIASIGQARSLSNLILTSREKPGEIVRLEGRTALVRSISLSGLAEPENRVLMSDKGISGSPEAWEAFIKLYAGNPLALKLASEPIRELFGGNIEAFLQGNAAIVGDIYDLIDRQFRRLSHFERIVMYWLAIQFEPLTLEHLQEYTLPRVSNKDLFESLTSLRRRSFIEPQATARFYLQPVILEYVVDQLVERVASEIIKLQPALLKHYALLNTQVREEVRHSQKRLILGKIIQKLTVALGTEGVRQRLKNLLAVLRSPETPADDYALGNVLNLLVQLTPDLSGYNFSGQIIYHAFLQGVTLEHTNFARATFANSIFTDTFGKNLSLAVSPNGKLLAAGSANNEIRLWRLRNIVPLLTLQGHSDWVRMITFSPDNQLLASASEDETVRLWDADTGRCLAVLDKHSNMVYAVAFNPDGSLLASCGDDQTIRIWEVKSWRCLSTFTGHTNKIWSLAFTPDGQLLVSASDDETIRIWEMKSGRCLQILSGQKSKIWTLALSPDGQTIASGSRDNMIHLWEVSSGRHLRVLSEHTSWIHSIAFSPNGKLLASGSDDHSVRLWEVSSGKCIKVMQRHNNRVRAVAFSPDGTRLISGSDDQTIRTWEVESGECLSIMQGYSNEVWTIDFSLDGRLLASGSEDQMVRIWEVETGECLKTLPGHTNRIQTIAFSPDSKLLATGSDDGTARLWDVSTGECLAVLQEGPSTWIWAVAFSPDGSLLATAGEDRVARLWETNSVSSRNILHGHTAWIRSTAFSPDGRFLVTSSDDQSARIWEVKSGNCIRVLAGHTNRVRTVRFSRNGSLVATGSDDQTVRIWQAESGMCVKVLEGHEGRVRSLSFSPDGTLILSGSEDHQVRIWEVKSGNCIRVLAGHTNRVRTVRFSPDGSLVASGSQDGKIILWNVQTGEVRHELISPRPYEWANIAGVKGLSLAQKVTLKALGAIEKKEYEGR